MRAPKKGKNMRKPMSVRQMAVIVAIVAAVLHLPRLKLWNAIPDEDGWAEAKAQVGSRPNRFIKFYFDRFIEEGNLEYHHPEHTSEAITKQDALNAAVFLKTGYWIPVAGRGPAVTRYVHRWYPSVAKACKKCAELRAIRDKYGLTNKQLLYWMKKYDPELTRRRIYCKYGFDDKQMEARMVRARSLLLRANIDPTFLDRCYFIDECTIWLDNEVKKGMKVYCDAHDQDVHSVLHYEKLQEDKAIKVHFIAAVNAVHGCVYLEFTTGTTDIQRHHNQKPNNPAHGPYKVSAAACQFRKITVLF